MQLLAERRGRGVAVTTTLRRDGSAPRARGDGHRPGRDRASSASCATSASISASGAGAARSPLPRRGRPHGDAWRVPRRQARGARARVLRVPDAVHPGAERAGERAPRPPLRHRPRVRRGHGELQPARRPASWPPRRRPTTSRTIAGPAPRPAGISSSVTSRRSGRCWHRSASATPGTTRPSSTPTPAASSSSPPRAASRTTSTGSSIAPRDLRLAFVEASNEHIGSLVDQLLLFCFHYDPTTGRYSRVALNAVRARRRADHTGAGHVPVRDAAARPHRASPQSRGPLWEPYRMLKGFRSSPSRPPPWRARSTRSRCSCSPSPRSSRVLIAGLIVVFVIRFRRRSATELRRRRPRLAGARDRLDHHPLRHRHGHLRVERAASLRRSGARPPTRSSQRRRQAVDVEAAAHGGPARDQRAARPDRASPSSSRSRRRTSSTASTSPPSA